MKEYGSKYPSETLERNLSKLYQYIRGADQVDGQAITEAATSMGKSILKKSQSVETEQTERYKDVRDLIKNTKSQFRIKINLILHLKGDIMISEDIILEG